MSNEVLGEHTIIYGSAMHSLQNKMFLHFPELTRILSQNSKKSFLENKIRSWSTVAAANQPGPPTVLQAYDLKYRVNIGKVLRYQSHVTYQIITDCSLEHMQQKRENEMSIGSDSKQIRIGFLSEQLQNPEACTTKQLTYLGYIFMIWLH